MIPRTAAPGEVCPYHRIVNLSPDLKYRVTTDCCDPARIVRRPMFILPPAQEWYYRRQHPDYRPLPPLHPGLSGRGAGNDPIEIIYPQPGRVLVAPKSLEGRQQSMSSRPCTATATPCCSGISTTGISARPRWSTNFRSGPLPGVTA